MNNSEAAQSLSRVGEKFLCVKRIAQVTGKEENAVAEAISTAKVDYSRKIGETVYYAESDVATLAI